MGRKAGWISLLLVVCAVYLVFLRSRPAPASASARQILYYQDPMHPRYRSAKPGIAPDCGMPLVAVYADDSAQAKPLLASFKEPAAHVDAATRQLYGIQLFTVEPSSGHGTLRVYGRVAADQTRVYRVNLGTEGYVKETTNDAVGNHVTKDQRLAVIYSPEFLSVAGGYLSANERTPGGGKDNQAQAQNSASALARADRLRNLGMSDVQIEEISTSRKLPEDIDVVSPTDGFIIARDISPGMRFDRHDQLYQIADLRRVWILAEVFGSDALAFHPGATARISLPDTGESFTARVSNVLPDLDPVTHTLKPRLELDNPHFHLRPGMFVDINVPLPSHEGLIIPVDAVVNTGAEKHVFVEVSDGNFEARNVTTGWSDDNHVQVLEGLRQGDTVVSSGTFMIDSESRLRNTNVQ